MNDWEEVQSRKAKMMQDTLSELTEAQQAILAKVLELEWENRHLRTPEIQRSLKNFIQQEVR